MRSNSLNDWMNDLVLPYEPVEGFWLRLVG